MATKKNIRPAEPPAPDIQTNQEKPLQIKDLLSYFDDHAGTFESFNMLQRLFNDHVATGAFEAYATWYLKEFMYHFYLISEIIFKLETQAANDNIKKIKAKARKAG